VTRKKPLQDSSPNLLKKILWKIIYFNFFETDNKILNTVKINNLLCTDLEILASIGYPQSKQLLENFFSFNLKSWLTNARTILVFDAAIQKVQPELTSDRVYISRYRPPSVTPLKHKKTFNYGKPAKVHIHGRAYGDTSKNQAACPETKYIFECENCDLTKNFIDITDVDCTHQCDSIPILTHSKFE
jgi:hypothetical protein